MSLNCAEGLTDSTRSCDEPMTDWACIHYAIRVARWRGLKRRPQGPNSGSTVCRVHFVWSFRPGVTLQRCRSVSRRKSDVNGLILASGVSGRDTKEASLIKELCGTIPEQSVHAWAGLGGNGRNSKLRSFFWLTAGRNQTSVCISEGARFKPKHKSHGPSFAFSALLIGT